MKRIKHRRLDLILWVTLALWMLLVVIVKGPE